MNSPLKILDSNQLYLKSEKNYEKLIKVITVKQEKQISDISKISSNYSKNVNPFENNLNDHLSTSISNRINESYQKSGNNTIMNESSLHCSYRNNENSAKENAISGKLEKKIFEILETNKKLELEYKKLKQENKEIRKENSQLHSSLSQSKKMITKKDEEIETLKRKIHDLECELMESHDCIIDLEKKNKNIQIKH